VPRTFHLLPHTHWDREWYLPRAGFEARLVPFLDELIELLERDPALRFHLDGQTVLIRDYLGATRDRNREKQRRRIEALVRAGRLGVGPWYVLSDLLIPSGESLIRNLLLGGVDARGLGHSVPVLYSPDAFGQPDVLPALAAEFGLRAAVVWRGLGTVDGVDRDLYRWRAPDGRAVTLYHLPPQGYEIGSSLLGREAGLRERWLPLRTALVARAQCDQIAVFVGADHHAADPDLGSLAARLQSFEPIDRVRVSSLEEFVAAVDRDAPRLVEIAGELRASSGYAWSLQGVAATRSRQKRAHADAELWLARVAEPLDALASLAGAGRWRAGVVETAWRRLIESQFHDTIAGTVSDQVAAEQAVRLDAVRLVAREVARASVAALTGHDFDRAREEPETRVPTLVLWNPAPRARASILTAELTVFRRDVLVGPPGDRRPRTGPPFRPSHLRSPDGTAVPLQVLAVRPGSERIDAPRHYPDQDEVDRVFVAFAAPALGGLGGACLTLAPGARDGPRATTARATAGSLAGGALSLELPAAGPAKLTDRRTGQEYSTTLAVEDQTDRGDTYTPAVDRAATAAVPTGTEVLADGPLVAAVARRWCLRGAGGEIEGRTVLSLDAESALLRIRIDLESRARQHRLRLLVATGLDGPALAGAALGQCERPVGDEREQWREEQVVPTAVAQRFVAAGAEPRRLAVFAPGSFEYELTRRGELFVTLVRSVGALSRGDLAARPGHAGWPLDTPEALELGRHRIELAVAPVSGCSAADLVRRWEDAFLPPIATWFRDFVGTARWPAGLSLEGDDLTLECVKPAERGTAIVVRVVNRSGQAGSGAWRLPWRAASAARIRADETELHPIDLLEGGRLVPFEYGPRELVSVRLTPG
jgi:alpha-mannosidase